MTRKRLLLPTACMILFLAAPHALAIGPPPSSPDDGGSGVDAPDRPGSGIGLLPGRVYEGGFGAADHWDWYTVEPGAADHLHVEVHGESLCAVARSDGRTVSSCATSVRPASLWVSVDQGATVEVGLERGLPETYRISLATDGFAPRPDDVVPAPWEDDGGAGRDAPDLPVGLVAVGPGIHQGHGAMHLGDLQDWYRVDARPGQAVRVTLLPGATSCFDLVSAAEADAEAPCALQVEDPVVTLERTVGDDTLFLRVGSLVNRYTILVEFSP